MTIIQQFFILLHTGRNLKKQGTPKARRWSLLNVMRLNLRSYPASMWPM